SQEQVDHHYTEPDGYYTDYTKLGAKDYKEVYQNMKEPDTPPKSKPSDPYAHYIYHQELNYKDDNNNDNGNNNNDNDSGKCLSPKRTIIVGDVHGDLKGFDAFLNRVRFDSSRDTIVLAGDIVTKGSQSLEVIDRAIQIGAKCVRGNHDDTVIRWRGFLDSVSRQEQNDIEAGDSDVDDHEDDDFSEIGMSEVNQLRMQSTGASVPSDLVENSEHYSIAKSMSRKQYNYLRSCPLILTLPRELSAEKVPIHVVHAGIDPHRGILKQKPWVLINIRNLLKDGTPSRKKASGTGWTTEFNDIHHNQTPTKQDFMVVYGHDAGRGLSVMRWSIGLDTGCVYGGRLTGYVVETGQILSVGCSRG
ncbi:hypothetical protein BGZ76_004457, partial [Entomortierella beljakovae]